jgi:hypothetical protein
MFDILAFAGKLALMRPTFLTSALEKNSNLPLACALCMHAASFYRGLHRICNSQGYKPAFNPVHHPATVSIDHPDLFHALVSEALPGLPVPAYQISCR